MRRFARASLGSCVTVRDAGQSGSKEGEAREGRHARGLLHRSIVLAFSKLSSLHQVSHHSHDWSSVNWADLHQRTRSPEGGQERTHDGNLTLHIVREVLVEV